MFRYDVTGGRYEDADYATTGSGGVHARNWIKALWRPEIDRDAAIDLSITSLFQAADEDAATGGPDLIRGIFPSWPSSTSRALPSCPSPIWPPGPSAS